MSLKRLTGWFRALCNRETITYLIFGVLTTILNYIVFWVFLRLLGNEAALIANVIAFIAAVAFAYVTNKLYVFGSTSWKANVVKKELISFIGARLLTFGMEELGLLLAANVFHLGRFAVLGLDGILWSKMFLNVLVIIGNYVLSKWIVFKSKK